MNNEDVEKIHESIKSISNALECLQSLTMDNEKKKDFINSMTIVKEIQSNLYIKIIKEIKEK